MTLFSTPFFQIMKTKNEIDFYMYHNIQEYHDKKKSNYRKKYQKQKKQEGM